MRKPLLVANWKMNNTAAKAAEWLAEFLPLAEESLAKDAADVVVCPPFTALYPMSQAFAGTALELGAQDMYWEHGGAYTGEISAEMLLENDVKYVICGHSERRMLLQESSEMVCRKVDAVSKAGMTPILCVGESESIREGGLTQQWLEAQLYESLQAWDGQSELVVAYEPIWAIGTGKAATAEDAEAACAWIRDFLREKAGAHADDIIILYGGSVNAANMPALLICPNVDGVLVGSASLKPAEFAKIVVEGSR
jgi:triosephosphate isomerase